MFPLAAIDPIWPALKAAAFLLETFHAAIQRGGVAGDVWDISGLEPPAGAGFRVRDWVPLWSLVQTVIETSTKQAVFFVGWSKNGPNIGFAQACAVPSAPLATAVVTLLPCRVCGRGTPHSVAALYPFDAIIIPATCAECLMGRSG